jgi:hypothetical protein
MWKISYIPIQPLFVHLNYIPTVSYAPCPRYRWPSLLQSLSCSWNAACPCCKRPLRLELSEKAPKATVAPEAKGKYVPRWPSPLCAGLKERNTIKKLMFFTLASQLLCHGIGGWMDFEWEINRKSPRLSVSFVPAQPVLSVGKCPSTRIMPSLPH